VLAEGDIVGLIGEPSQVAAAERFINPYLESSSTPEETVDVLLRP